MSYRDPDLLAEVSSIRDDLKNLCHRVEAKPPTPPIDRRLGIFGRIAIFVGFVWLAAVTWAAVHLSALSAAQKETIDGGGILPFCVTLVALGYWVATGKR